MILWTIFRTVGLRALSWLLGAWLDPVGRIVIIAIALAAGGVGLRAHWIAQGRDAERAANMEQMRQAEAAADTERQQLEREHAAAVERDTRELQAKVDDEKRVRDENNHDGAVVLWRADDGWLRTKSARKSSR